jgi:hypothetical protein
MVYIRYNKIAIAEERPMNARGQYRKKPKLGVIKMSLTVLPEEREAIEALSDKLGVSMSGAIAQAVVEMNDRLEAEAGDR